MLFTLIFLALLSFGAGFAAHKHIYLKKLFLRPEPPALDTAENVLSYLEACTLDENDEIKELFSEFRLFINQKQLPAISTIATERPDWYHNPDADLSAREHWEIFYTDLVREKEPADKIEVVRHWMEGLENKFTYKEMEMILDQFEDGADRAEVRKIYADKKKKRKAKK